MLIDEVVKSITDRVLDEGLSIKPLNCVVGLRYTAVVAEINGEKYGGVSYTPQEDISHVKQLVSRVSDISIDSLPKLFSSPDFVGRAIATAFMNAVSSALFDLPSGSVGKDLLDVMGFEPSDKVAFIGDIEPLIKELKGRVEEIYVFERSPLRRRNALSDSAIYRLLPKATKVVISGAALVNDTIDAILELSSGAKEVAVVGATASIYPEPLFRRGIDIVAGFRLSSDTIDEAVEAISLAFGTRRLYNYGVKYVLTSQSFKK